MTQEQNDIVSAHILDLSVFGSIGPLRHPGQGQFVTTGLQGGGSPPSKHLGFCVQVRKGIGQFGSNMVFLRHPDGSLTTHENQSYHPLSELQEKLARTIFTDLPEHEDYSEGYTSCDKVHEIGFVVENSASQPSPVTPTYLTVTDADGSATCMAFV